MINSLQFKQILLSRAYNFNEIALLAFQYQYTTNELYHEFSLYLGKSPENVSNITDIPFLPIDLFKKHKIICNIKNDVKPKVFESSGTTGSIISKHYVYDESFYHKNAHLLFTETYNDYNNKALFFLLPSYLERDNSSLVSMANHFLSKNHNSLSGFFLNDYKKLEESIKKAILNKDEIVLFGVTFGLLDFLDSLNFTINYKGISVFETGGMKGRKKEITRDEVHLLIRSKICIDMIYSEYGMTELLSQAYSSGNGLFEENATFKVLSREIQDPLNINTKGKGGLNIIDLANIDSCCFIATEDQGEVYENSFKVLGRIDHSDIRGCNLLTL